MDKRPLQPNTLLGKVIEKENRFMKVVTKFGIIDTWVACAPNRLQITEDMNELLDISDKCIFLDHRLYNSIRLEFCRVVKHLNQKPSEGSVKVWQERLLRVRNTGDIK